MALGTADAYATLEAEEGDAAGVETEEADSRVAATGAMQAELALLIADSLCGVPVASVASAGRDDAQPSLGQATTAPLLALERRQDGQMAELRGEVRRLTALIERVGKATGAAPLPDTPDTPKPAALRRR